MAKYIDPTSRVQNLKFGHAWEHLEDRERNYAYWMSKACWAGGKIVPHQISYESPLLLATFQAYFACKDFALLEKSVTDLVASFTAGDDEATSESFFLQETG